MKWKQYIRVSGTPDIIMDTMKGAPLRPTITTPTGYKFRLIALKAEVELELMETLRKAGYKLDDSLKISTMTRPKYLLLTGEGGGISRAIRGHVKGGDILYKVESDDELDLLTKVKNACDELKSMGVQFDEVCRWSCNSAPLEKPIKMRKKREQQKK